MAIRPSAEAVRNAVEYDPETGELTWKPRSASEFKDHTITAEQLAAAWNRKYAGKPALAAEASGYMQGKILGYKTCAHRVAFVAHFGKWPDGEIDHINGNGLDNRIANLRDVPPIINKRNRKLPFTNRSGAPGVRFEEKSGSWVVTIGGASGERKYIGSFKDFDEAVAARKADEERLGYHPNHGRAEALSE